MPAAKKTAHEKVMALVERELKKNPGIGSADLLAKAKKVSRSLSGMSVRQFHAKYPLQVKRRHGSTKPGRAKPSKAKPQAPSATKSRKPEAGDREKIRGILLSFAKDVSAAESQAATIEVISNLDRYVDRILKTKT